MSRYELYLLVHALGAIVWVGANTSLHVLALRAERANDAHVLQRVLADSDTLTRIIIPSSLLVVLAGLAMVLDGPWSFSMLWIDLGLAGFAVTFFTGLLKLKPAGERLSAVVEADGGFSAAAMAQAGRLLAIARADVLVLCLVVADMVAKPTGDDVVLLAALAALLAAGVAYAVLRSRTVTAGEAAAARIPA
jgi:hypothetical protein